MRVANIESTFSGAVSLGKQGENNATQIRIDVRPFVETFGEGTAVVLHQRNHDESPYPVATKREEDEILWVLTSTDTEHAGYGRMELQWFVGDALAKSNTYETYVTKSLKEGGEEPEHPGESWVQRVIDSVQEAIDDIPSWAKQPNKPSYTAEEVGALPYDTVIPEPYDDTEIRQIASDFTVKLDTQRSEIDGEIQEVRGQTSKLSELIDEISDALFERTDASPNVYDVSKAEDNKYIKSDGRIADTPNTKLSAFIVVPKGKKLVFTRGDARQAITYRTTLVCGTAMLWDMEEKPIVSSRVASVSEIENATGHDCICKFSYAIQNTNYINQMAEIMDVSTPSADALGLKEYYEYQEASYGDKVRMSAVETESAYSETSTYPVNGKAIADAIKSPLFGKKILFLGDSFTNSSGDADYRYRHYIAQRTGCTHVNYGVTGSQITYRPTATIESFPARAERMTEDCDMVVIFGGINDCRAFQKDLTAFHKYYVIGTDDDVFDWDAEVNSLKACLKHVLDVLIAQYPTKSIVALLPPVLNPKSDQYSEKVNEICQAEIDIYEKYGIPYFDLRTESKISGCDAHVSLYNIAEDNAHWNANGHLRASWGIQKFLEREII